MPNLTFSIVCPTYQGEKNLPALIKCLEINFKENLDNPEIIFVIDNSSDDSESVLNEFRKNHPENKIILHKNQKNIGPAESRNIGVEMASGEIILFLDDDCRPNPNWYVDISKAWNSADAHIQGIGGLIVPSELETFNGKYCSAFQPIRPWPLVPEKISFFHKLKNYYQTPNSVTHGVGYLAGANMSIRKVSFINVGGFSPTLRIAEDIGLCKSLRKAYGDNCLVVLDILFMPHDFTDSFKNTLRRSYGYGLGSGRNFWAGNGAFSVNPGPGLIVGLLLLFLFPSASTFNSTKTILYSLIIFLMAEILFYTFFVIQKNENRKIPSLQGIKFGFAFLMCETANTLGFFFGLSFTLSKTRRIQ
jgi:glycosyltransferase involved in cell wall biosynthesis